MKRQLKYTMFLLLIFCILVQGIYISKTLAAGTDQTITILFTHDLHSNFLPIKYEQNGEIIKVGGFARLQTAIKKQKELDPEALLLDGGDYSMGTPFQTIFQHTSPELRLMGRMGYDVVTIGNHEFDYRAEGLADSLNTAKDSGEPLPQMVLSNAVFPLNKEGDMTSSLAYLKNAMDHYGIKDYTLLERKGIKIGIFGLMGEEAASMAPMSEVEFGDAVENAKRVVKILKEQEKADLIICLSHSGTNQDKSKSEDEILAKKVPEIDVILSGHTHHKYSEPLIIGNTIIGSAEEYGKNLGVIKLSSNQKDNWDLKSYELIPIHEGLAEDEEVTALVDEYKRNAEDNYFNVFNLNFDDVIARAPFSFPTQKYIEDHHQEATLGNLISDSYVYAVKRAEGENYIPIDAAIVPVGTIRSSFIQGDITTVDAFNISSLGIGADKMSGYPLISVYLTGKELKAVCEVDASVTPLMDEAQLFISGMQYTFNPNRLIFNKVTNSTLIRSEGDPWEKGQQWIEEIEDDKLYRIVAGLYSAQMLSVVGEKSFGLLKIEPKTKDGEPVNDYEAQIIYDTSGDVKSEVKEWYAIVSYLQSFPKEGGIPVIPEYYYELQGRKKVEGSRNIIALLSKPNWIAWMVYGIILILAAIIITIVVWLVRRSKRRRRK
ncbi:bifunctional metallophosphatase/5'-nucleotidase [Mobilitalea sibirica]|uniref:Bifunctional metallophosphatase/5'-nucleotidase n=1 Tax=Mobilitalea sibirica TaxID=1462919 RepID=A0A8J7KSZ7_9FIRM|nr:bifunctional UDP-sugar hydrolase/5'-nucleotidase [Mobilitalea sibirica]MBH1940821.1 bifunctional metallophosphatase/5'-nucleotidase [Mobilitalea sibirica]